MASYCPRCAAEEAEMQEERMRAMRPAARFGRPLTPPRRPYAPARRPIARWPVQRSCDCPAHGTEFARWLQSSLNQVLGLRLPVNGVIDAATRSALRGFQQRHGLRADGIAGPETERALITAKRRIYA